MPLQKLPSGVSRPGAGPVGPGGSSPVESSQVSMGDRSVFGVATARHRRAVAGLSLVAGAKGFPDQPFMTQNGPRTDVEARISARAREPGGGGAMGRRSTVERSPQS